ncbi:MAG: hypothetical protein C5B58_14635 [Acidobacteria bacterium]|nr:MAG: hypothetical protein C5B58_14635 [Acidobacteriota bacterium]
MQTFTVELQKPAHEMAQEEILKQAAFISKEIIGLRFTPDGSRLQFSGPTEHGKELENAVQALCARIQRSLRGLQRKVAFQSSNFHSPHFSDSSQLSDVHFLGRGQMSMEGVPLSLFRYFDRVFQEFGAPWRPEPLMTPTLIPTKVLARCDYFRSFPQYVTFACHLKEEVATIDSFRDRHQSIEDVDGQALSDMERPEACLSPAVCYHVYHLYEGRRLPKDGVAREICGKCFRYESTNISDLRRLWDFTMREIVFMGSRKDVLTARERSIEMMADFLRNHRLEGEIRTASDPFFMSPDAASKTYYQLSSDSKFEISLLLSGGDRVAVGSHNYHSDFFGRVFSIDVEDAGAMHSVCVAFGLERWVHAFVQQHGLHPGSWPDVMRRASEFRDVLIR